MAKISIEIPTNNKKEYYSLLETSKSTPKDFKFIICMNGNELSEADEVISDNFISFYYIPEIKDPCISMMELRRACLLKAEQELCEDGVMMDGGLIYKEGAFEFVLETINKINSELKFDWICSLKGFYGSNIALDRIHIPKGVPFNTGLGLIYSKGCRKLIKNIPVLPGGAEDPLISSWLIRREGVIPLKRWRAPINIAPRRELEYYQSCPVHNRDISYQYNEKLLQRLWRSPRWRRPMTFQEKHNYNDHDIKYSTYPNIAWKTRHLLLKRPELKKFEFGI